MNNCPPVTLNNFQLPQAEDGKYLVMHLESRLTWRKHIATKNKQLPHTFKHMYWFLTRMLQMTLDNKFLLYKTILKPIWTFAIQLWGTASK